MRVKFLADIYCLVRLHVRQNYLLCFLILARQFTTYLATTSRHYIVSPALKLVLVRRISARSVDIRVQTKLDIAVECMSENTKSRSYTKPV